MIVQMNNEYIKMYCDRYNLKVEIPDCTWYCDKILTEDNKIVAMYSAQGDSINFIQRRKTYKKSDLLQFVLENVKAH